jgi:hypothetical protein
MPVERRWCRRSFDSGVLQEEMAFDLPTTVNRTDDNIVSVNRPFNSHFRKEKII